MGSNVSGRGQVEHYVSHVSHVLAKTLIPRYFVSRTKHRFPDLGFTMRFHVFCDLKENCLSAVRVIITALIVDKCPQRVFRALELQ